MHIPTINNATALRATFLVVSNVVAGQSINIQKTRRCSILSEPLCAGTPPGMMANPIVARTQPTHIVKKIAFTRWTALISLFLFFLGAIVTIALYP